jgi:hypothetical protein
LLAVGGVPFLPFVLLLAWQAISRSASFALGWATALYFGQVPGRQGRVLAVISLVAAGWVVVVAGFGVPLLIGAAADWVGLVERNFDVTPALVAGLAAAIVVAPPAIAAATVWVEFHGERSVAHWLRIAIPSYLATASLGVAVLEMVLIAPAIVLQRVRSGRILLELPLVPHRGADEDDLVEAIRTALASQQIGTLEVEKASGPRAWPLLTLAFAADRLLGSVVRGEPVRLRAEELEVQAHSTTVSILAAPERAYPVRAALERELAFRHAYLTWSETSQQLEDELGEAGRKAGRDPRRLHDGLEAVQARIDAAEIDAEEWNVLYRLRLQLEHEVREAAADQREKARIAKPSTRMSATSTTSSRAPQLTLRSG